MAEKGNLKAKWRLGDKGKRRWREKKKLRK